MSKRAHPSPEHRTKSRCISSDVGRLFCEIGHFGSVCAVVIRHGLAWRAPVRQADGNDPAGRDRMSADGVTTVVTTASQNQPNSAERQGLIIEDAFCGCSACSGDGCFSDALQ
jgi:hypothetical protein